MALNPNDYIVDYNDKRLTSVKDEQAIKEAETTKRYDEMINNSDAFYNSQIEASKEWAQKQSEIQQANTDFAIEKIEQQKEQAQKDYTKEQKGAYTDYQKQSNAYGVNAEQIASSGLSNTGYSEASRISMYNTYQNRVATARESLNQAVLNFDNSMKEAILANNSALAEIAANALQKQLELSLQGFQYKNTLIQTKEEQLLNLGEIYNNRYQQVLSQINAELDRKQTIDTANMNYELELDKLNQQIKQFNQEQKNWMANYKLEKQKADREQANWEKEFALAKQKAALTSSSGYSVSSGSGSNKMSKTATDIMNNFKTAYTTSVKDLKKLAEETRNSYANEQDWINRVSSSLQFIENKITSGLKNLYSNGKITKSEMNQIRNELGF